VAVDEAAAAEAEVGGEAACLDPRAGPVVEACPDPKDGRRGGPPACRGPGASTAVEVCPDLKVGLAAA
jgi:hypothetical protein